MSISAYVGLPGHGKSYGVVENVIIPAAKEYRTIFTNIPLNTELFLERFGIAPIVFDVDEIRNNPSWFESEFQSGALFVIDECWRLWPAGTNANRLEESHKAFFAEHRHLVGSDGRSTEIVLVTQDLAQIASFMRNLVETTFRVTKLSKVGSSKSYRVDVFSGAVTGPNPPESRREKEIFGRFTKDIYKLYKSHTKSEVGAGNESRADSRFNVLKGFKVKAFFVVLALLVVFVWWGSGSLFKTFGKNETPAPVPSSAPSAAPVDPLEPTVNQVEYASNQSFGDDLLRSVSRVYISFNNGRFPEIDYLFRIVTDEGYADLTASDLSSLGYQVDAISQCLARISINKRFYVAVCESQSEQTGGFINDLASTSKKTSF